MVTPIEFQHEAQLGTIEVHDEPVHHVLAAKLQPEDTAIAQERPCVSLFRRRSGPELARQRQFLGDRDRAQRIHATP